MKGPVLPHHKDDDGDSLSDDDNNNNMTRLNSMTRLVSESWRAVESAALAIPADKQRQQKLSTTTNGSSGRLGGSIRSPGNSSPMWEEAFEVALYDRH
eukprot:scaffold8621_cov91-Cylindrotheca_fusiformis.AAC.3